jgi:hypothetical protein
MTKAILAFLINCPTDDHGFQANPYTSSKKREVLKVVNSYSLMFEISSLAELHTALIIATALHTPRTYTARTALISATALHTPRTYTARKEIYITSI